MQPGPSPLPQVTDAERAVADLLPIEVDEREARAVLERVPLWFHTFSLGGSVYTPGVARDHRYRAPFLPTDLSGASVLDVGTFDGFYAFLAESRGASRVVAVDNEQYRDWVRARWGVELEGGEGLRAIAELLDSAVEYLRLDAFDLDLVDEQFDLVLCFGILHRVENPLGLLRILRATTRALRRAAARDLRRRVAGRDGGDRGRMCRARSTRTTTTSIGASQARGLAKLAVQAGFEATEVLDEPIIDGHPRVIARISAPGTFTG